MLAAGSGIAEVIVNVDGSRTQMVVGSVEADAFTER